MIAGLDVDGKAGAKGGLPGEQVTIAELRRFVSGRVEERLIPEQLVESALFGHDLSARADVG